MRNRSLRAVLVCFVVISAMSCAKAPPTAQTGKCRPTMLELANVQPLGCYIYGDHTLGVGNASATAIPKGTPVSFTAKLVNAGAYCATVPVPQDIPPHLFVPILGQPLFDDQAPCQAWREVPLVNQ
jgi:hypothetical protein